MESANPGNLIQQHAAQRNATYVFLLDLPNEGSAGKRKFIMRLRDQGRCGGGGQFALVDADSLCAGENAPNSRWPQRRFTKSSHILFSPPEIKNDLTAA